MKYYALFVVGVSLASPTLAEEASPSEATWIRCLKSKAALYAQGTETAGTASYAVMGACRDEEAAAYAGGLETPFAERLFLGPRKLRSAGRQDQHQRMRDEFQERVLSMIVELRAGRSQQ